MKLVIIIIVVLALVALLVYLNRKPTTDKKPIDHHNITGERMTLREALEKTWNVLANSQTDDIVEIDKMCQIMIDRAGKKSRYKVLYISLDTMESYNIKYVKENTESGLTTLFYDYPDGKDLLASQFQEITNCPPDGIVEYLVLEDKSNGNMDKTSDELPSPIPYESMTLETALEKTWEVLQDTETMDFTEIEIGDTGCQIRLDDETPQLRFCVVYSFSDNLERPDVPDYVKEKYEGDLVYLYYEHSPKGKNLLVQQLQEVLGCTLKDIVNYYHWVVK
ncbi:MAG: hypothetical protein IKI13_09385 [Bacteroidales bacterium]|nr:hypothetical protein [Bacteroidales bacterium]